MSLTLIVIGVVLLLLSIVFALPFLGVGLIIPGLGDLIDIPLAFVFGVAGIAFLAIGGLFHIITTYWWVLLIVAAAYLFLFTGKGFVAIQRLKK